MLNLVTFPPKVGSISFNEFRVKIMMFNTTFNNISVIPRQSVLLVEEIGVQHIPRENQTCCKLLTKLYHIMLNRVNLAVSFNEFRKKCKNVKS